MAAQILNHLPDELLHGVQAVDHFVHAPVDTLKERGRAVEAALRDRFGGYDKSLTKESLRKRQLERYRALFDLLDDKGGWPQGRLGGAGVAGCAAGRARGTCPLRRRVHQPSPVIGPYVRPCTCRPRGCPHRRAGGLLWRGSPVRGTDGGAYQHACWDATTAAAATVANRWSRCRRNGCD